MLLTHNKVKNEGYQTIKAHKKVAKIANMEAVLPSIIAILCFLAVLTAFSFAADGYRSHFLSYGPGVAAAGQGETFTAAGDDMSVIYYNPALLTGLNGSEISASHWFLYDTARYDFVGFSDADTESGFALAGTQFYRGNIEARQNIDDIAEIISNSQMAVYGAYAGVIPGLKLKYGASIKWLSYEMDKETGNGYGLDIGLAKQIVRFGTAGGKKLIIESGLLVQNPAQVSMKMPDEKECLPRVIKLGLAATATVFPRYSAKQDTLSYDEITLASDLINTDNHLSYTLGLRYKLYDLLLLRVGYKEGLTAGIGFIFSNFQLDYAFMAKEFTNFHKIGFTYRFGQKDVSEEKPIPTFTDEFQKVYQEANRIYDKYFKDSTAAAEQGRWTDAAALLKKAIPLKPQENQEAKQLLATCEQMAAVNKMNEQVTEAKRLQTKNDFIGAYKKYLDGFDANPEDKNILLSLDSVAGKIKKGKKGEILKLKTEYIRNIASDIDMLLWKSDYSSAEKQLKKIEILALTSDQYKSGERKISDKKKLAVNNYVTEGMDALKNDKPEEAYQCFSEAEKLSPEDTGIQEQKQAAKNKYMSKRKFTIEDKVYADKLYYLAAISFATDEMSLSTYRELKNFNPVYEHLPELEETLIDREIIERRAK